VVRDAVEKISHANLLDEHFKLALSRIGPRKCQGNCLG
jgi:hypothetical protein